jgi:predicted transposase YbfD/YdcC
MGKWCDDHGFQPNATSKLALLKHHKTHIETDTICTKLKHVLPPKLFQNAKSFFQQEKYKASKILCSAFQNEQKNFRKFNQINKST